MSNFIYFPSFSTAGVAPELKKDFRFSSGTTCRFYAKEMNELRYPYFLLSAGANYRNKKARESFGLTDDVLVVGDSGGFQIKTGNLEWKPELREIILRWLENNSDIAMNLDIPPGGISKFIAISELFSNHLKMVSLNSGFHSRLPVLI